jgi:hypothetical protein
VSAYPLIEQLRILADAADRLLTRHDFDGDGHEVIAEARDAAHRALVSVVVDETPTGFGLQTVTSSSDVGTEGVDVLVFDAKTGRFVEHRFVRDDYMLICIGNRYVKSQQAMGRTHMIAIAVDDRPAP